MIHTSRIAATEEGTRAETDGTLLGAPPHYGSRWFRREYPPPFARSGDGPIFGHRVEALAHSPCSTKHALWRRVRRAKKERIKENRCRGSARKRNICVDVQRCAARQRGLLSPFLRSAHWRSRLVTRVRRPATRSGSQRTSSSARVHLICMSAAGLSPAVQTPSLSSSLTSHAERLNERIDGMESSCSTPHNACAAVRSLTVALTVSHTPAPLIAGAYIIAGLSLRGAGRRPIKGHS